MDNKKTKNELVEITICAMFASLMFATKVALSALPNIHLVGVFIIVLARVYRSKALYSIYIYVLLEGLIYGFSSYFVSYLYVWTILWAVVMFLPKEMKKGTSIIVFSVVCGLHGFLFGTLCAPSQALILGMNFNQTIAWIVSGIPFDLTHGFSNLILGTLIYPIEMVLVKINSNIR